MSLDPRILASVPSPRARAAVEHAVAAAVCLAATSSSGIALEVAFGGPVPGVLAVLWFTVGCFAAVAVWNARERAE